MLTCHPPGIPRANMVTWYTTWMRITESARRHGVIGADVSGRMLELVARTSEAGEVVVFHAMPLRTVNAKRYLP